jgi:hypothetical protein
MIDFNNNEFIPVSQKAVQLLIAARSGEAHAQFLMGEAFRIGEDVPLDFSHALHWFHQAAEQDHSAAQNNVGAMIFNGMGTESNSAEAAKWYRKAADNGNVDAQFNLAKCFLHGNGIEPDSVAAVYWLEKAIEQGHVEAICELGTLYRFGQGVEKNLIKAAELHVIAAMDGNATSINNLKDYQNEIEKAALNGNIIAALCLAKMYDRGIVVEKDKTHVNAWLQWAKLHGNTDEDSDVLIELSEWEEFESMLISKKTKQQTKMLLVQMQKSFKRE